MHLNALEETIKSDMVTRDCVDINKLVNNQVQRSLVCKEVIVSGGDHVRSFTYTSAFRQVVLKGEPPAPNKQLGC